MNNQEFKDKIIKACTPLPGSTPEPAVYTLTVKQRFEGLNIIDFFNQAVPRSTPDFWIEKVESGNLKVNNSPVTIDYRVKAGDVTSHQSEPKIEPEVSIDIKLIYEDDDYLVIDKPSPLPMHASGRFARNTLINILEKSFPKQTFKMIHRIDANTTGLVVIGKNKTSVNLIRKQFEDKTIRKEYIALVEGIIEENYLSAEQSIGNKVVAGGAREIDGAGKKAKTHIEVIERRTSSTLLKIRPTTGRTNQIRLHLSELGHPIVGDLGYKDPSYFENNPFTYPDDTLFLHAHKIQFTHPKTNKLVSYEAPIPDKFCR